MKKLIMCLAGALSITSTATQACTGMTFTAGDGARVIARTVEAHEFRLDSHYGIFPRRMNFQAQTPEGKNGKRFSNRFGFVGLTVQEPTFTVEGMNYRALTHAVS